MASIGSCSTVGKYPFCVLNKHIGNTCHDAIGIAGVFFSRKGGVSVLKLSFQYVEENNTKRKLLVNHQ